MPLQYVAAPMCRLLYVAAPKYRLLCVGHLCTVFLRCGTYVHYGRYRTYVSLLYVRHL